MVLIEHTVSFTKLPLDFEDQVRSVLEHMRYSGSRVREWEINENGRLTVKLIYKGTAHGWEQMKRRLSSFIFSIEDEHRYSEQDSFIPHNMSKHAVKQCLKCGHIWRHETHLRKNGQVAKRCPKCNSNQTCDTSRIKTKVWKREDLLILTDGQYPDKFCPRTSIEETIGILVDKVRKARLVIGRGFENSKHGHKAILITKNGHQMDTHYIERQSMKGAVAWCPPNARVFIGGLGLGLILLYLAKTGKASEVVVCEIDKDVIALVEPKLRKWFDVHYPNFNWKVIEGDALEEVLEGEPYDWIFMDIWKSAHDIKLMKKAEEIGKQNLTETGRITCWMKDKYEKKQRRYKKDGVFKLR